MPQFDRASNLRRFVLELDHSGFQFLQIKTSVSRKRFSVSIPKRYNRKRFEMVAYVCASPFFFFHWRSNFLAGLRFHI